MVGNDSDQQGIDLGIITRARDAILAYQEALRQARAARRRPVEDEGMRRLEQRGRGADVAVDPKPNNDLVEVRAPYIVATTHGVQPAATAGTDGKAKPPARAGQAAMVRYGAQPPRPLPPVTVEPAARPALSARLIQELKTRDAERFSRYRQHLEFYRAKGDAQWVGAKRSRERRLTLNYARAMCIKATSYVTVGLAFAVDPEEDTEEARERAARTDRVIALIAEENNLPQLLWDTELDTAVLGDGALKVLWDEATQRVRILAVDVQGLWCWWRAADPSTVWRVAQRWDSTVDELAAQGFSVASSRADRRVSVLEVWTAETFDLFVDGRLVEGGPNPYGVVPYVVFPNLSEPKEHWGVSDIAAIYEPARELNRAFSQVSQILELSGNPIAVLAGVTQAEDIAVAPGAVWELPPEAKAYLLDLLSGGGVQLHARYIDLVYRALHDLGETPRTAFGGGGVELSGVALNTELDPLMKKVQRKRTIRANAYRKLWALALALVNRHTDEDVDERVRVVWGPVLPRDRSRLVNEEVVMVQHGIHSRARAMSNVGVEDPEAEFARWLLEQAAVRTVGVEASGGDLVPGEVVSGRASHSEQSSLGDGGGDRSGGSRRVRAGDGGGGGGGGAVVTTPATGGGGVFDPSGGLGRGAPVYLPPPSDAGVGVPRG